MTLDAATLARASRALHSYSVSERSQDQADAGDALSDLVIIAQITGDAGAERQLEEALGLLAIGPASANEAYAIIQALSR